MHILTKKIFTSVVFILIAFFFCVPLISSAQEEVSSKETPVVQEGEIINDESSLEININNVVQLSDHRVGVGLGLLNQTHNFIDELSYVLEFYQGNALATEGELFASTTYITALSGTLPSLYPGESSDSKLTLPYTKGIPEGNYLFRLVISNSSQSVWAIAYTEEPVLLSGDGTMLPVPAGFIRTLDGDEYEVLDGAPFIASSSVSLVLPLSPDVLDYNERYRDQAGELNVVAKVYKAGNSENVIYTYPAQSLEESDDELSAQFAAWPNIKPGMYDVRVDIVDANNESVLPYALPLKLITPGFYANVLDVKTGTNIYRADDPLDVSVQFGTAGEFDPVPATLRLVFTNARGEQIIAVSSVMLEGGVKTVSFQHKRASENFKPVFLGVEIIRDDTGEVLDSYSQAINPSPLSSVNYDTSSENHTYLYFAATLISFILFLVFAAFFARQQKGNARATLLILTSVALAATLIFGICGFALLANAAPGDSGTYDGEENDITHKSTDGNEDVYLHYSKRPSGNVGTCSQSEAVVFSVKSICFKQRAISASTVRTRLIVDGSTALSYVRSGTDRGTRRGGKFAQIGLETSLGPISHNIALNNSDYSKSYYIDVTSTGTDCAFGGYTSDRTISCYTHGKCGSEAPAKNQGEVNARGACSAGEYVGGPTDTASTLSWGCDGIGTGNDVVCHAPVIINGDCGSLAPADNQAAVNARGACDVGDRVDLTDTSSQIKWRCDGKNGGSNETCSANKNNQPPNPPVVTGDPQGVPDASYTFFARATDPDGDKVTYGFDWDRNGTVDAWTPGSTSYVVSGATSNTSRSWSSIGKKDFQVLAKDDRGGLSSWTQASITLINQCFPVKISYKLTPSIVQEENDKCTLKWDATNNNPGGNGASCAPVTCTLDGGSSKPAKSNADVGVGFHTLTCSDGGSFQTTVYPKCVLNPDYREF